MVYTGMSKQVHMETREAVDQLTYLSTATQKIRMNGSAALDICQSPAAWQMRIWSLGFTSGTMQQRV